MPSFFLLVRFLSLPAKQRKKMNIRKKINYASWLDSEYGYINVIFGT